jgi:hypothetical protein
LGWIALYDQIRERAWWPGLRSDVKRWVQHCPECQLYSRNDLQRHEEAHVIQPMPRTLGRWYIDWIGPLPETENGNKWIWIAIEETCRWPIARAVKHATAEIAARLLYQEIVVNYETPEEIVTDRGRNFLAQQLQSYLKIITAKHLKTSAYHPRTNGKVENYNALLGSMLAKCVKEQGTNGMSLFQRLCSIRVFEFVRQRDTRPFSYFTAWSPVYLALPQNPTFWTRKIPSIGKKYALSS